MSAGRKLQWQRILDQPLMLKASVDYEEASHGPIRHAALSADCNDFLHS